jgi:type VI secretion system protein ImpK
MQPIDPAAAGTSRPDTLPLLYQNIFTGIVRIQAGRQPLSDLELFRKRMRATLREVERDAGNAGYDGTEIRDAEFAIVAFLDEAILSSKDPKVEEWRKRPLNIDLFGQAIAGDVFFDKLADIERRGDSTHLADVLEVYLLCLLLGFEGRFAPPLRSEAYRIMERLRSRIEAIRGLDYKLSPPLDLRLEPIERPNYRPEWPWWALGGAIVAGVFLIYWTILSLQVGTVQSMAAGLK